MKNLIQLWRSSKLSYQRAASLMISRRFVTATNSPISAFRTNFQTIAPAALQTSSILLKNFFYWERILTIEERSSFSAQDKNGPHYC